MNELKRKLMSRKFWAGIVGFAGAVLTAIGCPELSGEQCAAIIAGCSALAAYIIGEGIADMGNK
ncbi:MAG: hypothetical protein J6Q78_04310 [Clostridia bacterium]|jgi:hypothetical protein|nr:hypothetical protein [Clostridia bacterium]